MPTQAYMVPETGVKMSSITLQREEISTILSDRDSETSRQKYKSFCKVLLSPETEESAILEWLSFLKDNIYLLDNNEAFVKVLLQMDWLKREESVAILYGDLILNLVSAHTHYLSSVLQMIIKSFSSGSINSEANNLSLDTKRTYTHKLLQSIIRIVPMSPQLLMQLLAKKFPFARKDPNDHLSYVKNLFLVIGYLPSYQQDILEIIISKMLDIDVNSPKPEIEVMELEDQDDDDNAAISYTEMDCEPLLNEKKDTEEMKHPLANCLDLLMNEMFCFIDNICGSTDKTLNWEETKKLYKDFLTLFDRLILPTYACAHVQFILFYICRLKWSLCEGFIDYLWKKVQNPSFPPVMRQVSACYVGSLLARARYIPISSVRDVLNIIMQWVHKYIDQQAGSEKAFVDTDTHGTFYIVCQMTFYIFAFRHKELIEMENGLKYLHGLNFERVVNCRLNPLKVCLPSVVTNFAKTCRNYQLVYCYTIIERNNRSTIQVMAQTSYGLVKPTNISSLEVFFPFDPYILKRSGKKIQPLYRVYEQLNEEEHISEDEEFIFEEPNPLMSSVLELEALESSPVFKNSITVCR